MAEDKDLEATRGGQFPYSPDAVETARERLAPPSIADVRAMFGGMTTGSAHECAVGETHVCSMPAVVLGAAPTPSADTPPELPEPTATKAGTRRASAPELVLDPAKMYAVTFNRPVEIEAHMVLSPHATHTMSGEEAEKHKAYIDGATEVAF